ncbi:MAG TPA: type II toxin-antitoxin system VapB family antitoxin [Gammaproteobacteria bacterium]|nr:type II toxin-antitoxin system VapB family antitoxin [Gammaproteobacteria bacterium]
MKTTVDIPKEMLEDAMRFTRAKTKREAILAAMEDFNRRQRMRELIKYSGTSNTLLSNEEIEELETKRLRKLEKIGK